MHEESVQQVTRILPIVIFIIAFGVGILLNILLVVWPFCKIFSKAGYHWALGILMIVPFGNIIMPFILAFGDWPVLLKNRSDHQIDKH